MNSESYDFLTVRWDGGGCQLIDQTRLPYEECYVRCTTYGEVVDAIQRLVVRGAPAIGVAGAFGATLAARQAFQQGKTAGFISKALDELASARPTAINLKWAIDRFRPPLKAAGSLVNEDLYRSFLAEAQAIQEEDIAANKKMAAFGAETLPKDGRVLTYCNAGALATSQIGTALGVILEGYRRGIVRHVYTCETRPVLQGLRLTAWELTKAKVPFTGICDNMVATTMARHKISAVVVGADRITRNGDVANKVGTYGVAIAARHHGIPFYVAAPLSSFDFSLPSGDQIPIEERPPEEIYSVLGSKASAFRPPVFNPAFDITPAQLVKAYICEKGVFTAAELPSLDFTRGH